MVIIDTKIMILKDTKDTYGVQINPYRTSNSLIINENTNIMLVLQESITKLTSLFH